MPTLARLGDMTKEKYSEAREAGSDEYTAGGKSKQQLVESKHDENTRDLRPGSRKRPHRAGKVQRTESRKASEAWWLTVLTCWATQQGVCMYIRRDETAL